MFDTGDGFCGLAHENLLNHLEAIYVLRECMHITPNLLQNKSL